MVSRLIDLGEVAYNARFEKYKIPWHDLPEETKDVWRNVARAVILYNK